MRNYPWYVSFTYLIYLLMFAFVPMLAVGYVVFWLDHNGWWFAFLFLIWSCLFKPQKWAALYDCDLAERYRKDALRSIE